MYLELSLVVLLLFFSGFFSCTETALTSLSKAQLTHLKKRKARGYKKLVYLKENPGIMLATILIGNNLVNILLTTIGTLLVLKLLNGAGVQSELWTTIITTFISAFFVLVFGEITPKTLGLNSGPRFALFASRIIVWLSVFFKPAVFTLNKISGFMLFILRRPPQKGLAITEEELLSVIDAGQETGAIEKEEKNMLRDVIRFGDSFVGEIMTPLDNVLAAENTDTIAALYARIKDRLPSRIPVFTEQRRNIVGILYLKDLLQRIQTEPDYLSKRIQDFPGLLRPPFVAYIDQKSAHVMRHMRFQHIHIAIVKNHNKKTVGILTFEDLLEEIIGDIKDEYEKS